MRCCLLCLFALVLVLPSAFASRAQAQVWPRLAGYRAATVRVPAIARLGARMFRANITFDDPPFERRMAGLIDTVTVESVQPFLAERDPAARSMAVQLA